MSVCLSARALGLVAVASLITARPVFEIFTLSDLYTETTDNLAMARYLAAGEALLVLFHGTALNNYILLGGHSLLSSSWLMLRDSRFGKAAAYAGVFGNTVSLGLLLPDRRTLCAAVNARSLGGVAVHSARTGRTFLRLGRPS